MASDTGDVSQSLDPVHPPSSIQTAGTVAGVAGTDDDNQNERPLGPQQQFQNDNSTVAAGSFDSSYQDEEPQPQPQDHSMVIDSAAKSSHQQQQQEQQQQPSTPPPPPPPQSHVISEAIDADDFEDEAYGESTTSSYLSSLASDIRRGVVENGRVYPNYGRHEYGMPIDEDELDRNDLQHAKFTLLLNKLFLAPIAEEPRRILDIGTGTGIWAMDMGDLYPGAEVTGTDLAPVQPTWVPPNVQFVIEDCEDTWTFAPDTFDFVFAREMSFAVRDWPRFMAQAFTALKPGGWLELGATWPRTHCDDGSLDLSKSFFVETVSIYFEIAEAMGASLEAPHTWAELMKEAGFVDVEANYIKMPMGPWAKDKRLKKVGILERSQLDQGYEAYMIRGWTQVLKKPAEELYALIAGGRKEILNPKNHTYAHFIVATGRKPEL